MRPTSIEDLQAAVRANARVLARGGGTKPALSTAGEGVVEIDTSAICGVVEYEPGEFTITALAGTPVADVVPLLQAHGQYLPFDPILVARGATLGGTVAAGTSGPGRLRYGGVRDFLIGVRYVDSAGRLVRSGGKVVKNAAGFDISKLMVGSLGRLGILTELTFKVFPQPEAYVSVRAECPTIAAATELIYALGGSSLDLHGLELAVGGRDAPGITLWARLGGMGAALPARAAGLRELIGGEIVDGDAESAFWRDGREMAWAPAGFSLVKAPLTPARIGPLEARLAGGDRGMGESVRRYSAGGQVAWIALAGDPAALDQPLAELELSGLALWGPAAGSPAGRPAHLGPVQGEGFARRVRQALDPALRFQEA